MARTPTSTTLRKGPAGAPSGYQTTAPGHQVFVPVLAFWAILLPAGLAIQVGDVTIPPYRFALLALAPFALFEFARRQLRLAWPDYLVIVGSLWVPLAYFMNTGIDKAVQGGGSFVVDTLGSYFVGRAYITDVRRLRTFLIRALPGVIIMAAILGFEAITHRFVFADLFPVRAKFDKLYEVRLGMLRARATFPHSVSAGFFMTSLLPLYLLSGLPRSPKLAGFFASLGAVFTVSSSAFLTIALTAFLIAYRSFFTIIRRTREKMIYLAYGFAALFVALELFTGSGAVRALIRNFTLDPASGYYRILIWDYGTTSVNRHPWFGIGDAPMARASWMVMETIDNHWLMLAVKYGLPAAALTFVAVVAIIWRCAARNKNLNELDRAATMGMVFSLSSSVAVAWTGALWANNIAWFMLLIGIAAALTDQLAVTYRDAWRARQAIATQVARPA